MKNNPVITVVEDDLTVREGIERILSHAGYAVKTVSNAADALKISDQARAGVFIVDVQMPGNTSLELLQELKVRNSPYEAIIITGSGDFENFKKAQEIGVFGYIHKPFSHKMLVDYVAKALERVAQKQEKPPLFGG
jgi:DNA-binding NtrC family response regulator